MTGTSPDPDTWAAALAAGGRRPAEEVRSLVEAVLDGRADLDAFGRWLVALADAGETAAEITGVAAALRARMLPLPHAGPGVVADTCGTGGDGSGSFNISTAAALVVAAAGQPVAKHGNRAVSSRTGSADVLEALGVNVAAGPTSPPAASATSGSASASRPPITRRWPAWGRCARRSVARPSSTSSAPCATRPGPRCR